MNIFEKATKKKLRFNTAGGTISVEDLWDLPLSGGRVNLDTIARNLNKIVKESSEESFVKETKISPLVKLSFDIVKSIITTKQEEQDKNKTALANKAKKQYLFEVLERKENAVVEALPPEEIRKLIEEL